jgi:hypothetical protein
VPQHALERVLVRAREDQREHAIGQRGDPDRQVPKRGAEPACRVGRSLEPRLIAGSPGGEHRARGVEEEERLRIDARRMLLPLLENGLSRADSRQHREGGDCCDREPARSAGRREPEQ